ncbi:EndoU domain-containing protein [Ehrlichia ruminantium]|nr:hypothetical protein AUR40_00360 [Ehrlichia ruminantium]
MNFYRCIFYLYIFLVPLHSIAVTVNENANECVDNVSGLNFFFKNTQESNCDLLVMPEMHKFDKAILDICGDWGHRPKREDFRNMLDNVEYKEYVDKIYAALDHQVFTQNADLDTFKKELVKLWFKKRGFTHIMCGEPNRKRLGGMHFFGRYVQAQQNNWAGRYYNSSDEVSDRIFTIGVVYKNRSNQLVINTKKSYDLSHADDLIIHATKAYKALAKNINLTNNRFCLYDHDNIAYALVASKDAVVTFFADLTPNCRAGEGKCNCIKDVA